MTDTIELLERIGRDAGLRHASTDELVRVLTDLQGSEGLRQAAMSGDSSTLVTELGPRETQQQQSPTHWGEDDEAASEETEEEQDSDKPDPE
jgi:hypothetical protein